MTKLEKEIDAEISAYQSIHLGASVRSTINKVATQVALKWIKRAYEAGVQNGTEIPREQWLREQKLDE